MRVAVRSAQTWASQMPLRCQPASSMVKMRFDETRKRQKERSGMGAAQREEAADSTNSVLDKLYLKNLWGIRKGVSRKIQEPQTPHGSL